MNRLCLSFPSVVPVNAPSSPFQSPSLPSQPVGSRPLKIDRNPSGTAGSAAWAFGAWNASAVNEISRDSRLKLFMANPVDEGRRPLLGPDGRPSFKAQLDLHRPSFRHFQRRHVDRLLNASDPDDVPARFERRDSN